MTINDELEQLKRVDLVAYLEVEWGYKRDPRASWARCEVLRHEQSHDKVGVIHGKDGHWAFYSYTNPGVKGTIIDFVHNQLLPPSAQGRAMRREDWGPVLERLRPLLGVEAQQRLRQAGEGRPVLKAPIPRDLEAVARALNRALAPTAESRATSYLFGRGLRPETLFHERFRGTWREEVLIEKEGNWVSAPHNAIFPHTDDDGRLTGFERKNLGFTGFSSGGRKTVWRSNGSLRRDRRIVVGESAIDVMSYHQLHPSESTLYISIAGQLSERQKDVLGMLMTRARAGTEVIAAFDNDDAGQKYVATLRKLVLGHLVFREDGPRDAKDWNDVLKVREASYIAALSRGPTR